MNLPGLFEEYAAMFERTFDDDNWQRLETYFHPQAVYETHGFEDTRFEGRQALLNALQSNVSNFDRKCDSRKLRTVEGPVVEGNTLTRTWACEFTLQGAEDLLLEGRETVTYDGGKIRHLLEEILPASAQRLAIWLEAHATKLSTH